MHDEWSRLVLLANVAATWFLTGLIWFVQVVHYPLFSQVEPAGFRQYHADHVRLTTVVVAGPMLLELATSLLLAWRPPLPGLRAACWIGLALVLFIWIVTAMIQAPQHNVLALGLDDNVRKGLAAWNWLRTIAWTARGLLAAFLVYKAITVASGPST